MNGKPNPTWNHSAVRESSDYLVDMLAAFRTDFPDRAPNKDMTALCRNVGELMSKACLSCSLLCLKREWAGIFER